MMRMARGLAARIEWYWGGRNARGTGDGVRGSSAQSIDRATARVRIDAWAGVEEQARTPQKRLPVARGGLRWWGSLRCSPRPRARSHMLRRSPGKRGCTRPRGRRRTSRALRASPSGTLQTSAACARRFWRGQTRGWSASAGVGRRPRRCASAWRRSGGMMRFGPWRGTGRERAARRAIAPDSGTWARSPLRGATGPCAIVLAVHKK